MDERTRRLRKYEAPADIVSSDAHGPRLDFYSPFGPLIAKTRFPAELVQRINDHAEGIVSPDKGSEFVLPEAFVSEGSDASLARHVGRLVRRYVEHVDGSRIERVDFERFWIVSQYAGTPSPVHFHTGDISGVLYLKVPELETGAEEGTYISGRHAGYINFLIGGKQRFARSLISFRPEPGDFYIFPGWLLHGAEPFRGSGERRSMAFNAFVPAEG